MENGRNGKAKPMSNYELRRAVCSGEVHSFGTKLRDFIGEAVGMIKFFLELDMRRLCGEESYYEDK